MFPLKLKIFFLLFLSVIDRRQRHHPGELFVFDDPIRFDVSFFEKLVH